MHHRNTHTHAPVYILNSTHNTLTRKTHYSTRSKHAARVRVSYPRMCCSSLAIASLSSRSLSKRTRTWSATTAELHTCGKRQHSQNPPSLNSSSSSLILSLTRAGTRDRSAAMPWSPARLESARNGTVCTLGLQGRSRS